MKKSEKVLNVKIPSGGFIRTLCKYAPIHSPFNAPESMVLKILSEGHRVVQIADGKEIELNARDIIKGQADREAAKKAKAKAAMEKAKAEESKIEEQSKEENNVKVFDKQPNTDNTTNNTNNNNNQKNKNNNKK